MVAAERYFAEQLASLTEGRYRVIVMPGGTLGDDNRVNEMVRTGRLAFAKTLLANLTAYDRRLGVLSLPYAFTGRDQCLEAVRGELGRRCTSILEERGLIVLGYFYGGERSIYNTRRPVQVPGDLRGLRIRVPQNILSIDMINALGGSAVPMATNDILSALQLHLVDGAENNPVFYVDEQHARYAQHYSWTRHQQSVDVLLASKTWLASQPTTVREAVMTAGQLAQEQQLKLWSAATSTSIADAKQQGAEMRDVDIPAFRRTLVPVLREHRGTFGDLASLLPSL